MELTTTARNATLADLAEILKRQQAVKMDAVVPAQAISSHLGTLYVQGLGMDGPAGPPGQFVPTHGMVGDIAESLSIPVKYARKMLADRPHLFDANVNEWLLGSEFNGSYVSYPPDNRRFLFRGFLDSDGGPGIARALLSDSYRRIDHLDMLLGVLSAIKDTGLDIDIVSTDLSERRMFVKMVAPEVQVVAERLLENYRNPFEGLGGSIGGYRPIHDAGGTEPIINAGLIVSNSETGGGACILKPWLQVKVCLNGLVIVADMLRSVHLGARQDEGIVQWSHETERLTMELIKSRTADAVRTFLNYDYLANVVERLEEKAVQPLSDPGKAVEMVGSALSFNEQEIAQTLSLFVRGGQNTAGGVLQAISALAQTIDDPERANDVEGMAIAGMELAFAAA